VEFLDKTPALSSRFQSLEELSFALIATQFSQSNSLPPSGAYTVGPDVVNVEELRRVASAHPDHRIAVYLPGILFPYLVLINFFYCFFSPSSVTLHELDP